jgi:mono/diheme cytochrome c family protein
MCRTVVTIISAFLSVASVGAQSPDPKKPDPRKIEAGKTAYDTQKCATCHAIQGVGGKLSTDLSTVGAKFTEADIKKWLTTPAEMEAKLAKKPVMPMSVYQKSHKLTDADVDALVAYMLSLK